MATYPPRICGIATYTASLLGAIAGPADARRRRLGVVSLTTGPVASTGPPVVFHHRIGNPDSLRDAIRILNTYESVSIQHEYGIFGGTDGAEVIDLMEGLKVPASVTLHTVLTAPTPNQEAIMRRICQLADRIVVMSDTALERLGGRYEVDPAHIRVLAHGADADFAGPSLATGDRPLLLTWGLIGPGKGLEWAIEAFAGLTDLDPLPRYLIAGATHPQVRLENGESYRRDLMALAEGLGLNGVVEFDDRYFGRSELAALVRSADLVILPYESAEQVTSGVLVEAIAASKPVIATPFPHAVELLPKGAGAIVPHGDTVGLSEVIRHLLSDPEAAARMTQHAGELAAEWYWPSIGEQFDAMMSDIAYTGDAAMAAMRVGDSF